MSTKLERILGICFEVNRGRYPSLNDLCRTFEIKPRTLYDDLMYINERLEMDIKYDKNKRGYYNADPSKKLPQFDLLETEMVALTMGSGILESYTGETFRPQLEQAIDKIQQRLPDMSPEVEQLRNLIAFRTTGVAPVSRELWFDFKNACEMHLKAHIQYFTAYSGTEKWRTIDPYMILQHNGAWYLASYCHMRKDYRLFALHRIRSYKISDDNFQPSENFDAKKWVDEAFLLEHGDGEQFVVLKFSPVGARYASERTFHPTQKLASQPDGSLIMTFTAHNLDEVKRWILTYGSAVEVVQPAELRQRIKDELSRALKIYDT